MRFLSFLAVLLLAVDADAGPLRNRRQSRQADYSEAWSYSSATTGDDSPETLLSLVNAERSRYRLAPLAMAADLIEHSRNWSGDMSRRGGTSSHALGHSLRYSGEVCGWNYSSSADVFGGWMRSSGHRAALMNPNATSFGAARVGVYWTAVAR